MDKKAITSFVKSFIPPVFLKVLKRKNDWGWFGPYPSWEAAERDAIGYDAEHILAKMQASFRTLKNKTKLFELDTILYDEKKYNTPLLFALTQIALHKKDRLNIIDFGGSLGSSFYWSKEYIHPHFKVDWRIIEQSHIVAAGKAEFETDELHFFPSFETALANHQADVLLLSSVMQYIEHPEFIFEAIEKYQFPNIIIDRTPYFEDKTVEGVISLQLLNANVYGKPTTLTCRIFGHNDLLNLLSRNYDLVIDQNNFENLKYDFYGHGLYFRFLYLKRKSNL